MGLNKVMKQLCVTAALVVLSTVTAFAANVGQGGNTERLRKMSIFCSLFFRKNQKIQVLSTENY